MLTLLLALLITPAHAQLPGQQFTPYMIDEKTHAAIMQYLNNMPVARVQTDPLVGLFNRLEEEAQRDAIMHKQKQQPIPPKEPDK